MNATAPTGTSESFTNVSRPAEARESDEVIRQRVIAERGYFGGGSGATLSLRPTSSPVTLVSASPVFGR